MTSPWNKDRIGIRFNQAMEDLLTDDFVEYLEAEYNGPTEFLETALRREKNQKPSLEERIEELDNQLQEKKQKKQRLIQKRRQRQKQDELERKKRKLQDLQKEVERISREGLTSRTEAEEQVLSKYRTRSRFEGMSDDEIQEEIEFERQVQNLMTDESRVQELVQEIQRLQDEVAELNGGPEDWFIDPEDKLEVATV